MLKQFFLLIIYTLPIDNIKMILIKINTFINSIVIHVAIIHIVQDKRRGEIKKWLESAVMSKLQGE